MSNSDRTQSDLASQAPCELSSNTILGNLGVRFEQLQTTTIIMGTPHKYRTHTIRVNLSVKTYTWCGIALLRQRVYLVLRGRNIRVEAH